MESQKGKTSMVLCSLKEKMLTLNKANTLQPFDRSICQFFGPGEEGKKRVRANGKGNIEQNTTSGCASKLKKDVCLTPTKGNA